MIWFAILSLFIFLVSHITEAAFPDNLPKRHATNLIRRTSDPCCKSCGTIAQVLADCPVATTDIFCGCDQWVATAPDCEACIYNVAFNTTFALNPGPALEMFWAFCQCQKACRSTAMALFGPEPCGGGTDPWCVSSILAKAGPRCEYCLREVDEWFASFFSVWVRQGAEFVKTGKTSFPGM